MIQRNRLLARIETALRRSRIVALVGPRQVGKTTLARHFVKTVSANYFDLEDPVGFARLSEPATALANLRGLVPVCTEKPYWVRSAYKDVVKEWESDLERALGSY